MTGSMYGRFVTMQGHRYLWPVLSLLFCLAAAAAAQDDAERQALIERHQRARERLTALDHERGILLFRKTMSEADSRYLLLDLTGGRGSLNYRNRVLRDFKFRRSGVMGAGPGPGMLMLTEKGAGEPRDRVLLFGKEIVLRAGKPSGPRTVGKNAVELELRQQDLAALFFVLEIGSPIYIVVP